MVHQTKSPCPGCVINL